MEIQRLVTLVSPHIRRATRCNFALIPEVQLLALLRFYAVGSFLDVVGDGTILSKALVSRGVAAVTPILLRHAPTHPNAHHTGQGPPGPQWISCHGRDL
ncbi:putative nuclease HARBI1 [Hypomesus transpacificus]|uniref:putative nuclease HARBI1 n=1 Tax=Hypomesus transpacificus TaxID=137520 RepID=UPI001F07FCC2|nr:putative nuclease HARBI1 [Hypomesus transpacificus]